MKIAFFLPRRNHIKIIGPVAAEAKSRGHKTFAVVQTSGPKDDTDRAELTALGLFDDVVSDIGSSQWVVAVGLRTAQQQRLTSRPIGIRWAALDSCGDNLTFLLEGHSTANWDLVTTLSEEAKQFAVAETGGYFGGDLISIGYPELDQLHTVVGDRAACRAKWNLPAGQMVVFFGTAARPIRLGRVRRWWFQQLRYWQIVRALRAWCDAREALLVAKTRLKHGDPAWLTRYCDRIIGDVSFYPFTTLELLRAADLYVGFASAMAIEAAAVGIPQLHLHGWPPWRYEWPAAWPMKQRFFVDPGGYWSSPGSCQVACYQSQWAEVLDDRLDLMVGHHIRNRGEAWAGPLDGKASARFLDLLESRC